MQAFLVGLVFAALFLLGVLTVWMQSEAFDVGYRIEVLQREAESLRRENDRLRTYLAVQTTPSSLLVPESLAPESAVEPDAAAPHEQTLMPDWNVVWFDGSNAEAVSYTALESREAPSTLEHDAVSPGEIR